MAITTMTSREFNQDASKAKRAASNGPMFQSRVSLLRTLLTTPIIYLGGR